MPIEPLELYQRISKAPRMSEMNFDRLLATKAKEITARHGIEYEPAEIVPTDDALVDEVWKAGYELALEVGLYCKDNRRRLVLSEQEIERELRKASVLLTGHELPLRGIDDKKPLSFDAGPSCLPIREDIFLPLHISYAQEPGIARFYIGNLLTYRGVPIEVGTPTEILGKRQEVIWAREALDRVGKQHVVIIPSPDRFLIQPHTMDIPNVRHKDLLALPHLKVTMDSLMLYTYTKSRGLYCAAGSDPMIGLYGGPDVTLVISVAEALLHRAIFGGSFIGAFIWPDHKLCRNPILWINSLFAQVCSRQKMEAILGIRTEATTGTSRALVDIVLETILSSVSGAMSVIGPPTGYWARCGGNSGLDYRISFEAGLGMAGITRKEASELLPLLIAFSDKQEIPTKPVLFEECYDLATIQPTREWLGLYNKTKKEMQSIGVKFADAEDYR